MKKFLFTIGMALFCGTAFAQNSAIFKAQALEQKGDIAGAAALLEEALKHPKTTKFAEMYHQVAEDNAKLFNPELMKAAQGLPFDTAAFCMHLDKMVDHLQGGFEGIQLERAAEHPDFDRIRVREIDRRITSGAGILCVAHLLGWRKTDSIPCRPAIHLGLRAAAEPQKLSPEFLYKVQQPRNRGFLLLISTAKGQTRNVNVKSAGSCRVAEVPHALRFAEDFRPRHFVQMVFERHRMGDKFKTFIQTAVRLYIQIFTISVGDVQQLLRVAVDRAALVDFQLYAKMPQALAVEHKVGRIVVVVNRALVLVPAV